MTVEILLILHVANGIHIIIKVYLHGFIYKYQYNYLYICMNKFSFSFTFTNTILPISRKW